MRPVGRRWRRRGGRQEGRREGREMGMGMAEGEWAAKRGLPAPKLAGERAASEAGRQPRGGWRRRSLSPTLSPPSSVSCRNSPALPALGCFQTLGSRFLIWALAASAAPRVVSLSCTSEHSGSLGKCSSCTVGQYSRSSSLAPSPLLSRARCQFTRGIRRLLRRRRSAVRPSVRPSAFWTLGALNAPLLRQRTRWSSARPTPTDRCLQPSS